MKNKKKRRRKKKKGNKKKGNKRNKDNELKEQLEIEHKERQRLQEVVNNLQKERKYDLPIKTKKNTLKFAIIGDTHFGSLYTRADALQEFYKLLKKEDINLVFHAGDMVDGHKIYRGQEYELKAIGFEQQLELLVNEYPQIKGIDTYFILGNHDASFKKQSGINVGKEISERRSDLKYLCEDIADAQVKIGKENVTYQLNHPSGGTAYAVSYKSQKIIESFPGGEKPRALFIGHYHKAEFMPQFRNIKAFQVGTFQSSTPYMKRKPTPAHVGGWIVEDTIGNLNDRFKAEFISFYEPTKPKPIKK